MVSEKCSFLRIPSAADATHSGKGTKATYYTRMSEYSFPSQIQGDKGRVERSKIEEPRLEPVTQRRSSHTMTVAVQTSLVQQLRRTYGNKLGKRG